MGKQVIRKYKTNTNLILTLFIVLFAVYGLKAYAAPARLDSNSATIYGDATDESESLGTVSRGSEFELLGTVTDDNGENWYFVRTSNGTEGYIQGRVSEIAETRPEEDEEEAEDNEEIDQDNPDAETYEELDAASTDLPDFQPIENKKRKTYENVLGGIRSDISGETPVGAEIEEAVYAREKAQKSLLSSIVTPTVKSWIFILIVIVGSTIAYKFARNELEVIANYKRYIRYAIENDENPSEVFTYSELRKALKRKKSKSKEKKKLKEKQRKAAQKEKKKLEKQEKKAKAPAIKPANIQKDN